MPRLDWGLASVLLAGDIEQEAEAGLLVRRQPLSHLVLKVAHHGSRSSTTEEFLGASRPALPVIWVGRRTPFGHPTPEVLARLNQAGFPLRGASRSGGAPGRQFGTDRETGRNHRVSYLTSVRSPRISSTSSSSPGRAWREIRCPR